MKKLTFLAGMLSLFALQSLTSAFAQDAEPAPTPADEPDTSATAEPATRAGQEVEINEDTYRQFMELKDANRQGDMMPEDAFKPGTGLQKLEKLPEESQKHLRNELREIIVQGDPWQPGDEDSEYPYVPSVAAGKDPSLQKQEQEAWGELVDSYNQREAEIYANSAKSSAALGSQDGGANNQSDGENPDGDGGQNEEGKEGHQAGQETNADTSDTAGTYSPNAQNDPNAESTAGVSQNAMEFLQSLGKGGTEAGGGQSDTPGGNIGQGGPPASSDGDGQTQGQGESQAQAGQQDSAAQNNTDSGTPDTPTEPNATSTAGTAQNALEFLKGTSGQADSTGEAGTGSSATTASQGESHQASSGSAVADGQQAGQGKGQDAAQSKGENDGATEGQAESQESGQDETESADQGAAKAEGEDRSQTGSQGDVQSQDAQQTESAPKTNPSTPPAETSPAPPAESVEESTAGASQNALEYLTGESAQTGENTGNEAPASPPEGTLNILDLLNAQGVGTTTGAAPTNSGADDKQNPDDSPPEKDGGGL